MGTSRLVELIDAHKHAYGVGEAELAAPAPLAQDADEKPRARLDRFTVTAQFSDRSGYRVDLAE